MRCMVSYIWRSFVKWPGDMIIKGPREEYYMVLSQVACVHAWLRHVWLNASLMVHWLVLKKYVLVIGWMNSKKCVSGSTFCHERILMWLHSFVHQLSIMMGLDGIEGIKYTGMCMSAPLCMCIVNQYQGSLCTHHWTHTHTHTQSVKKIFSRYRIMWPIFGELLNSYVVSLHFYLRSWHQSHNVCFHPGRHSQVEIVN